MVRVAATARSQPQPSTVGQTLRGQKKRRSLKADFKTSPYCVRWEVLRPKAGAGSEPLLLEELRKAAIRPPDEQSPGVGGIAIGLKAVSKALEAGDALGVLACTEGVPSVLVQHLPVMCALRGIPIAILAA